MLLTSFNSLEAYLNLWKKRVSWSCCISFHLLGLDCEVLLQDFTSGPGNQMGSVGRKVANARDTAGIELQASQEALEVQITPEAWMIRLYGSLEAVDYSKLDLLDRLAEYLGNLSLQSGSEENCGKHGEDDKTERIPAHFEFARLFSEAEEFWNAQLEKMRVKMTLPNTWRLETFDGKMCLVDDKGNEAYITLAECPQWDPNTLDRSPEPVDSQANELHLLTEFEESLGKEGHDAVVRQLPQWLQGLIRYMCPPRGQGLWTLIHGDDGALHQLPLTIAGRPVIIPVQYRYPLMALGHPLPDPYPELINPVEPLTEELIDTILQTYSFAQGFYLLINGMLQILVADGFEYDTALSNWPIIFGGLKVSYINVSMVATGAESLHNLGMVQSRFDHMRSSFKIVFNTSGSSITLPLPTLGCRSVLEVRPDKSLGLKSRPLRFGLKVGRKGEEYLTAATHVLKQATEKVSSERFLRRVEPVVSSGVDWVGKVGVYAKDEMVRFIPFKHSILTN